jgi:branched-chain amino acid transport system substrate-binding protein
MPSMTGWITSSAAALCAGVSLAAAQDAVVVGAVVSQTGAHATAAAEYRNGMLLWQEHVNAAGGLLGRRVDLRLADDGSEAARAGRLYADLIEAGAQVLIGPYGSAATLTAMAEAERTRRVLLNAGGPSTQVHKRAPRYVFQTSVPYAAYAEGVLELARQAGAQSLMILGRDDAASREMAEAALAYAGKLGFRHVEIVVYPGTNNDFLPQLYEAMAVHADAWIAFGETRDGADMVKTLKRHGYVPKLFYARASPDPRFIELVGQDAEHTLGSRDYDARFARAANAQFVKAYAAKWSSAPNGIAAAGYTAGVVLTAAVARAGTLDAEKLRAALATLEVDTLLGRYRVDQTNGAQVGMKPVVMQIVHGRTQPVWPAEVAGGRLLEPFIAWSERKVLQ